MTSWIFMPVKGGDCVGAGGWWLVLFVDIAGFVRMMGLCMFVSGGWFLVWADG
jgi:hypothetical protein